MQPDRDFQQTVWDHYHDNSRGMPWRENTEPYWIIVSEIMLQQTQAERVIPKFESFIEKFPSFEALAQASLGDVLKEWVGLGYNRRAKFLHEAAKRVVEYHQMELPQDLESLVALPGIGPNTAGAIQAYAFNLPVIYIETNIRAVFIHHFFPEAEVVDDSELMPLIEANLDHEHPREWYWALMDYGSHLKKAAANPSRRSKHHAKQSKFEGSDRQVRAAIVRELTNGPQTPESLLHIIDDKRVSKLISQLVEEGMIVQDSTEVRLP